jgi:hypothetical protein
MTAFWVLLALVVGFLVGWSAAHKTVAIECDRLGAFFVGTTVYHCTSIDPTPTKGPTP